MVRGVLTSLSSKRETDSQQTVLSITFSYVVMAGQHTLFNLLVVSRNYFFFELPDAGIQFSELTRV